MQQLLISIKGQELGSAQFDRLWDQLINDPQPAWLRDVQASPPGSGISIRVSQEVMQAILDFVNAKDWDATRKVIETQQALLFQPEMETLFEQNISQARATENLHWAELLEMHLALLRDCKANDIEAAFAKLAANEKKLLPFDAELLPRSIAALLGSPQEKMAYMQSLMTMAKETTDEDLKVFINTIQLALFSPDFSQLGRDLKGSYRQAWETITASVEAGGVDPRLFETIASNTRTVLGPDASRRGVWRSNLAEVRNQVIAKGDRNMAALLDAVIGLLDASGNPAGLGEGLKGIYAQTWQEIVGKLDS